MDTKATLLGMFSRNRVKHFLFHSHIKSIYKISEQLFPIALEPTAANGLEKDAFPNPHQKPYTFYTKGYISPDK